MHKLLPVAALLLTLLTGCGTSHTAQAPNAAGGAFGARSKLGVDKGIRGMFHAAFKAADLNHDNKLSLDELPSNLPAAPVPGADPAPVADPAAVMAAKQALFDKLDLNKDGFITYREFARPEAVQAAVVFYRSEVAKLFAGLDKNGDHVLTPDEVTGGPFKFADLDANKNGKVTLSEFEDAFVRTLGGGPDPAEPAAPPAPAPAASDAPASAPASGGDAPAVSAG